MHFQHPKANRDMRLGEAVVAYTFTRARRRSIGFSVGPDGLAVRAPHWVGLAEVENVLRARADWILRKLLEARQRQIDQAAQAITWRDGVSLPYLGDPLTVVLDPQMPSTGVALQRVLAAAQLRTAGQGSALELALGLPEDTSAQKLRDVTRAWLMRQVQQIFQQRLDHYAPLLGVRWTRLGLSNAGARWGSAKEDGSIRLNWRLVHVSLPLLDYVVVHELSHLRVMNHSPRFWEVVGSVLPEHAALRRQLKQIQLPRWD